MGIGIAGEGGVLGTSGFQFRQRKFDVFGSAHHLRDGLDVARMLGAHTSELIVGTLGYLVIGQRNAATQIHVEVLGMQAFAPLKEQANGITLDGESCAHQRTGGILNGGGAVAHTHGDVVEGCVDVDSFGCCGLSGKTSRHGSLTEVFHGCRHRLTGLFIVERQQFVGFNLVWNTRDGSGQTGDVRVEISIGGIVERKQQTGRQLVGQRVEDT